MAQPPFVQSCFVVVLVGGVWQGAHGGSRWRGSGGKGVQRLHEGTVEAKRSVKSCRAPDGMPVHR